MKETEEPMRTHLRGLWNELPPVGRAATIAVTAIVAVLCLMGIGRVTHAGQPAASTSVPAGSMMLSDYRGQTAGNAAAAIRGSLGQEVSIVAQGGAAGVNAIVTGSDPAPGQVVSAATNFVLYTDYVAPVSVYSPPPPTSEPPPAATRASDSADDSGSGSSSGGSVDLPHIPHPHAHVCVGGKHIHVCS